MFPTFLRIPIPEWFPWIGGGSIPIHAYGVMVALAMLVSIWVTVRRARQAGMDPEVFYDLGFWSMLAGIVGARIAYVYVNWPEYRERVGSILKIWEGGQVLYGGLVLAVLVDLWFIRRRNLPILKVADLAAPAVPLGIAIGRIGCLLNGCCWGARVDPGFPLGIRFAESAPVYAARDGGLFVAGDAPWPVHPTQIYATLLGILLYVVLSVWYARRRWDGQIFAATMVGYALIRLVEEHFRADTAKLPRFWGAVQLNQGQLASVIILGVGVLCYLLWSARGRARLRDIT